MIPTSIGPMFKAGMLIYVMQVRKFISLLSRMLFVLLIAGQGHVSKYRKRTL